jgi:hypothetical protein
MSGSSSKQEDEDLQHLKQEQNPETLFWMVIGLFQQSR